MPADGWPRPSQISGTVCHACFTLVSFQRDARDAARPPRSRAVRVGEHNEGVAMDDTGDHRDGLSGRMCLCGPFKLRGPIGF